ncbi:basic phospholipase A2 caudoxin-like [Anomaloglossus baeobatrachus]|uniref:basic phospholipase A2 caudoxin-like n=1 Tax=Anomaloglossus baeobatrachus TaxID=238106 RepID=UPI003F50135E
MVFSWIFPVCLRGTMLSSLLLLLSLVSVKGKVLYPKTLSIMLSETMNKVRSHFIVYGCQCGYVRGSDIVDEIDRCCHAQYCCYKTVKGDECDPRKVHYSYTYSNGTLTCDDEEESGCARKTCECDWKTVTCFMSHKYSKVNAKHLQYHVCEGKRPPCSPL